MSHLRRYTDFDLWFDAVADIDPLALGAPRRVTLDKPGLSSAAFQITTVQIQRNASGTVHYLQLYPSPREEHAIAFEDMLDANEFRRVWGRFDGDMPTEVDWLALEGGREAIRVVHGALRPAESTGTLSRQAAL